MNQNKFVEVTCPVCEEKRMARDDVVKKITKAGRPLNCKPCNNRLRFADKDHPRKGTGIKNNPDLIILIGVAISELRSHEANFSQ